MKKQSFLNQEADEGRAGGTSRRNFIIGGTLMAASGVSYARQPRPVRQRLPKGSLDKMIPNKIGSYQFESSSGLVLPPPDELSDRLYDDILTRVYTAPDSVPVMLLIAYSNLQDGLLQVHRPETCYPVGGYTLSNTQIIDVPMLGREPIPSRLFSADSAGRSEQVLYWTRIGRNMPTKWIDQRWAVVGANLRGEVPDGLLIRFSAATANAALAVPALKSFAANLVSAASPVGRRLLVG
jgi:EpsI family protein